MMEKKILASFLGLSLLAVFAVTCLAHDKDPKRTAATHLKAELNLKIERLESALAKSHSESEFLKEELLFLKEKYEELEKRMQEAEDKTYIKTPFGLKFQFSGHIKLDAVASDKNLGLIQSFFPVMAFPANSLNPINGKEQELNTVALGWRESRLSFSVTGPKWLGAQTSAFFSLDGYAFGNGAGTFSSANDNSQAPRFHLGSVFFTWPNTTFRFGSWFTPYGNYFLDGGLYVNWTRGTYYRNTTQVALSHNFLGKAFKNKEYTLELTGALLTSTSGLFATDGPVNQGELSGLPEINAVLRFSTNKLGVVPTAIAGFEGAFDSPLAIEIAGVWNEKDFGNQGDGVTTPKGEYHTRALEFRYTFPVIPRRDENGKVRGGHLSIRGSSYFGQDLAAGFESGATSLVVENGRIDEADAWGTINELKLFLSNNLWIYQIAGIVEVENHDGVVSGIGVNGGLRRTKTFRSGVWYRPDGLKNLLVGVEYLRFVDDFQDGSDGALNWVNFQWYFRF
ncbi:MAG: hypothetical protein ACE5HO_11980 [bacterium]